MSGKGAAGTRAIDLSIDVAAPIDKVWQTLTDPGHVARWFAPIASGEAREGGMLTVSWGPGAEWTTRIAEWNPPRHAKYSDAQGADEAHEQTEEQAEMTAAMATDYHLAEGDGGTCVRLVNSGFSTDPEWDPALRQMTNGWRFFLWNLKHCVERHPGVPRTMISARPWVGGTREEVWDAVFGPDGAPAGAGEPFSLRLGDETLSGTTVLSDRPWAFAGMVSSLNDGIVHVEMEGMGGPRWKMGVWISAYGVDEARCDQVRQALEGWLARLFPNQE